MMLRAIRTEFLKFFTTRMWWGMAIGILATAAGITGLIGWATLSSQGADYVDPLSLARVIYTMGWKMGSLLLLVVGVMFVGQEFRHKTITSTFLSYPRRGQLMAAKVVAMMLIGMLYGVVYLLGSVTMGALLLSGHGRDPFPEPGQLLKTFALLLLILGFWGLIGLGVGILIPNQIAAILVTVALAWIVEPIVGMLVMVQDQLEWLKVLGKALPTNASRAMLEQAGAGDPMSSALGPWWLGLVVLICWSTVSAALGALLTVRKDIS